MLRIRLRFFFRFAVAVLDRDVEVIYNRSDCACDTTLLVERIAAHHQSADRAAAEASHGKLYPGAAEHPFFHRHSSICED